MAVLEPPPRDWWEVMEGVGIDPLRHSGAPCVFGTRVTALTLWVNHESGLPATEIAHDDLVSVPEVEACLAWQERLEAQNEARTT